MIPEEFEKQCKENRTIDGKDIREHPLYKKTFGEGFTKEEMAENSLWMALRSSRGNITLQDMARILKDAFPSEELAEICRILLKYYENE